MAHRDDCSGSDLSFVIGLTSRTNYTGGLLRVATTKNGRLNRRVRDSETDIQYRGSVAVDVSRARLCVLLNSAEHVVTRLSSGHRSVVVVHLLSKNKEDELFSIRKTDE